MTERATAASELYEIALRLRSLAAEARAAIAAAGKDGGIERDLGAADRYYERVKQITATEFADTDLVIVAVGAANLMAEILLTLDFVFDMRKQRPPAQ